MKFGSRTTGERLEIKLLEGGVLELHSESETFNDCYRQRILVNPPQVLQLLAMLKKKEAAIRRAMSAEQEASSE